MAKEGCSACGLYRQHQQLRLQQLTLHAPERQLWGKHAVGRARFEKSLQQLVDAFDGRELGAGLPAVACSWRQRAGYCGRARDSRCQLLTVIQMEQR
eukprot:3810492-Pleurochrysis_carterae.AAC.1